MKDYVDLYADCNECDTVEGVKNHTNKVILDLINKIDRTSSTYEDDPYYTSKETCKIMGVSLRTLDEYCSNNEIVYYKPKKNRLFKLSDINAFQNKGKRKI